MHRTMLAVSLLTLEMMVSGRSFAIDADTLAGDEQALKAAGLGTDGPALLDFFRKQTLTELDRERVQQLVAQLGDKSFRVREKASTELVGLGYKAIALLRPALKNPDREVARRVEDCLRRLENGEKIAGSPALILTAARLMATRKPAGAAEVLLGYVPFADDDSVVAEIQTSLIAVAMREGKPEPCLVKALTDATPLLRGIAGVTLARAGAVGQKDAVRKLLHDADVMVRLRVGLGLAAAKDKEAVPALIDLLAKLPVEQVWPVEELLHRLAQDNAPTIPLGTDAGSRAKCRDAWSVWWRERGPTLEMPSPDSVPHPFGYTLIVVPDNGSVTELDREGKRRWQVTGMSSPFDAQVLSGNRILVAEYSGRVTERNLKGDILWQYAALNVMQARRLSNGNTFLVTIERVQEVDPNGKEVWRYNRTGVYLLAARKLRNGQVVVIDGEGKCKRLDASGKELNQFEVGRVSNNCMEVLPNGNVLVARWFDGKVTEYDPKGKVVRDMQWPNPFSAYRLSNGNTLISSHEPPRVVEVDRAGKLVREHKTETLNHRPWFTSGR